ncbi:MAG: hypothetical protein NXI31_05095 [bacterium]|nr:hypothetical protein [bacterium]
MHPSTTLKFGRTLPGIMSVLGLALAFASGAQAQGDLASSPVGVSFASLSQMVTGQDYTVVQRRRFFLNTGVVSVREESRVQANGSSFPNFELDFLAVEGEPSGSPVWQHWSQIYAKHSGVFFRHGLFRVRDLASAQQNYTLHDFGTTMRIGRTVRRIVVFPRALDKSIWLLEIDELSNVPLYSAEYDSRMRLLSEVEAISLQLSVQLSAAAPNPLVTVHPDFAAAHSFMGRPAGVRLPSGATAEYAMRKVEVRTNPVNNQKTLVLEFTDGIDQFFLLQSPDADPFAGLPVRGADDGDESHTIARYRDPAMSVLLFWHNDVAFQVAGRGSLLRLDSFAKTIYRQSLSDG